MRKVLLILVGSVALLVLAAVGVVTFIASRVEDEQIRTILAQRLADGLGRRVEIVGRFDLYMGWSPSITVRRVKIANAAWGSQPNMLELGRMEARLQLLPLLARKISVSRLKLVDVKLFLETDAQGRGNWDLGGGSGSALPWFYQIEMDNVLVSYRDGATGVTQQLAVDHGTTVTDGRNGQVALGLTGSYNGNKFDLGGSFGPLASLLEDAGALSLDVLGHAFGMRLGAKGSLVEPRALHGVAVSLLAAGDDTRGLGKLLGQEVPSLGAWRATARLEDRTGKLALRGIELNLGRQETIQLQAKGEVKDLLAASGSRGLQLEVTIDGTDTAASGKALGWPLPALGSFQASAKVDDKDGKPAVSEFDIGLGTRDQVSLLVRGAVADPLAAGGPEGIKIDLLVEGVSTSALAPVLGLQVPDIGAYRLSTRLSGSTRSLGLDDLTLRVGSSDLTGNGQVDLAGPRPRIQAKLESQRLNLDEWRPPAARGTAPARRGRVFDATPLPLRWTGQLDLALDLKVKELAAAPIEARDAVLGLDLVGGVLKLRPSSLHLYDGQATLEGAADSHGAAPAMRAKLTARGLDAAQLAKDLGSTERIEGRLSLSLDLNGHGPSPRALAGSLNGKAAATLTHGRIANRHIEWIAADLLRLVVPTASEPDTAVSCAVAQFDIKAGVATAQVLLLDTKRVTVTGSGSINLGAETLALRLDPKPKEASLLSLAHPVLIGGTLTAPSVRPDPAGVAKGIGGAALGLAMGPVGLLLPFISGGTGEAHPCAKLVTGGK